MPQPNKWDVLRKRVVWILIALLVPSFILFFHATSRTAATGPGGAAGVIFGARIPWDTFQEHRSWIRRQLESQLGDDLPSGILDPLLNQVAWDRLIVLEEAKRTRLRVDDLELAAFIGGIAGFQDQGRFVPDRYDRYLRAIGMSPQQFEALVRDDLRIQKLTASIKASATVSEEEIRAAYVKEHEALTASVLLVETASLAPRAERALTEADARASYEAHPEAFRVPEQLVMEYAGLTRAELTSRAEAAEEDRVQEQLTTLALDLTDDLDAKRPFEEIVTARGLTARSAGPFPAGDPWVAGGPEPAILQAVADLAVGEVSRLIETDNGVFVARITQRIPARIPPFDEVKDQVRERLVHALAEEAARADAQSLQADLKARQAAGLRFEEAVLAAGVSPIHPAPFTRTSPIDSIGAAPALNEAAFAAPLGELSEVVAIPSGFALVYPEERAPPDESKFSEAEGALRQELLTRQETERVQVWLNGLRIRAKLQSFIEAVPGP